MKTFSSIAALAVAVSFASAQQEAAAYGQCGGKNQQGVKACPTGFQCHVYNDWYSQCVPSVASSAVGTNSSKCRTQITVTRSSAVSEATSAGNVSSVASQPAVWGSITVSTLASMTDMDPITITPTAGSTGDAASAPAVWGSITVSTLASSVNSSPIVITPTAASSTSKPASSSSVKTTLQTKSTTSIKSYLSTVVAAVSTSAPASSVANTTAKSASSAVASAAPTGSFPTTSGTDFVIDGETGYFAGTNTYWIGFLTNNDDVDLVMQHLKESGLKILRVWGFNDVTTTPSAGTVYFQSFAGGEPTINTGADGLERLDYVVKSAEAHGIKLIINFVNNWTDYGGMAAYFSYAGITDNTQWYSNTKAQTQYQAYIKAVVSRYPSSSAIFAWELANEPRCAGCDLSIMTTWITDTAKYIKGLDPNRMVTTGEEGFGLSSGDDGTYPYTTGAGGYDFATNCAIEDIDFCVYHLYPESWSVTPTQEWGNAWITNHAKACAAAGKPCLLEEFGATDDCTIESSWQATALKATGTGADLFWQYGDTLSTGESTQDGNTVYYGSDLYTCLVTNHVAAIDAA